MEKIITVRFQALNGYGVYEPKQSQLRLFWNEKSYSGGRRYVKINSVGSKSPAKELVWLADSQQWQAHGAAYGWEQDAAEALGFVSAETLTVAQAAIVWGVSKSTVYRWIKTGKIVASKTVVNGRSLLCVASEAVRKAA